MRWNPAWLLVAAVGFVGCGSGERNSDQPAIETRAAALVTADGSAPPSCGPELGVEVLGPNYAAESTLVGAAKLGPAGQLEPIDLGAPADATGATWLEGAPQPIGNGFVARFKFTLSKGAPPPPPASTPHTDGFAFVVQNAGPTVSGAPGGGLGYAGLDRALSIEFDSAQNAPFGDPTYEHIAVHTGFSNPVQANDSGGSFSDNSLPLAFDNGTPQEVRIEYRPAEPGSGPDGGPGFGTISTYMNANIAPIYTMQVDDAALASALGPSAFFGFTASKTGTTSTDERLLVSNVSLRASLAASGRIVEPLPDSPPGGPGGLELQAVDQCGVPMRFGGDASRWTVSLTNGTDTVPATITDNGDGTYTARYAAPSEGVWHPVVGFDGATVPGGPFDVSVVEGALPAPVITAPANGFVTTESTVTISGFGVPTAVVTLRNGGTTLADPQADANGDFSVSLPLSPGNYALTAQGDGPNQVSRTVRFTVLPPAPVITSPAEGSTAASATTTIEGTGVLPGATVVVNDISATFLPLRYSVSVDDAGNFSLQAVLPPGSNTLTFKQTVLGMTSPPSTLHLSLPDFPPVITNLPGNFHVEATDRSTPVSWPPVAAWDGGDGPAFVVCTPTGSFSLGTTTVTCSAQDNHQHSATASFTVTIVDTTPPKANHLSGFSVEATGPSGAVATFTPNQAQDLVDGDRPTSCTPASGSTFHVGNTSVRCTASDRSGNVLSYSFFITVTDKTPPVLSAGADVSAEATSAAGAAVSFATPAAQDLVDGNVSGRVQCAPASGSTFAFGTTTVTCSVADLAGNAKSNTFTVTVDDTTPPAIPPLPDVTVEATGAAGAVVTYTVPAAVDIVAGAVPLDCAPASGGTFLIGQTIVTCTATDTHGKAAQRTFKVIVLNGVPPQIIGLPGDVVVEATGPAGADVAYTQPTAVDAVDGPTPATCLPPSGATFPIGLTPVSCRSEDAAHNVATVGFSVIVGDTTAPLLLLPGTLTAEATGPAGARVAFAVSAIDVVDGADPVQCSASPGNSFAVGTTVVDCTTTDLHGNTALGRFTVVVTDTTAPTIGVPDAQTVDATGPSGAVVTYPQPTATDLVDVAVSCTPVSGATFPIGTTTVACVATDPAGNTATASFTVTVRDKEGPVFGPLPAPTAYATSTAGAVVSYTPPTATDAIDGPAPVICSPPPGSKFAPGSTPVTCMSADANGNSRSATFTVTVTFQAPTDGSYFLQPINADGSSIFKLGSTIPVKFKLTDASAGITNLVAKIYFAKVSNGIEGTFVEATATGGADSGNTFRYDGEGKQYIFNLSTKPLTIGTWMIKADLGDGVLHSIRVSLK